MNTHTSDDALVPAPVLTLARSALSKQARGDVPTDAERCAIERYRRAREARDRQRAFATVTKTELCAMAGRQPKVINEMAQRYELPIGIGRGRATDLNRLLKRFFDLLAMHGMRMLTPVKVDDPFLAGSTSAALEQIRIEEAQIRRLKRLELQGQLLPRPLVREAHLRMALRLRQAGEQLQRAFGTEAAELLADAMEDVAREVEALVSEVSAGINHTTDDIEAEADGVASTVGSNDGGASAHRNGAAYRNGTMAHSSTAPGQEDACG